MPHNSSSVFPYDRWPCRLLPDPVWVSFFPKLKNLLCFILGLFSLSAHQCRHCCSHKHCSQPFSSPGRSWCQNIWPQALLPVHDWYCWKYSHSLCFQFCRQWVKTLSCHLVISTTMAWVTCTQEFQNNHTRIISKCPLAWQPRRKQYGFSSQEFSEPRTTPLWCSYYSLNQQP